MACRYPGSPDVESFWRLLEAGEHAIVQGVPGSGVGRLGRIFNEVSGQFDNPTRQLDACRFAGLIEGVDRFDPGFFRISPVEAKALDPQQRLMLELSWQALEDAGIDPEGLRGSRTGIFGGVISVDYRSLVLASEPSVMVEPMRAYFAVSGNAYNTAVGRVSYALGLHGPAMALDTACSGSLVALHEAVTTLQGDEADIMLVSGVHVILLGWAFALRASAGMLSPDGRCATFDEGANGFVRGEGCGVVVLKRLADAIADGDRIWAVVRGSAVNQDGESPGLAVPNGQAQELLIGEALRRAGLTAADVDYVEAHGTGTAVGDPIELRALANSYGQNRSVDDPLLIGSVKTNVGHLESAAGLAGVMKVALAMNRGVIPKHLNFNNPTPHFDWDSGNLKVTDTATPWQASPDRPLRAGVSGFGWSGTNAHILMESYGTTVPTAAAAGNGHDDGRRGAAGNGRGGAGRNGVSAPPAGVPHAVRVRLPEGLATNGAEPLAESAVSDAAAAGAEAPAEADGSAGELSAIEPTAGAGVSPRGRRVLPLSAKSPAALRELAGRYLGWLDQEGLGQDGVGESSPDPGLDADGNAAGDSGRASDLLADLAWTAGVGRSHFSQRAGVVFDGADSLRAALERVVAGEDAASGAAGTGGTVGFVYTGMGSDWVGMGAGLYETEPVVRAVLDRCEELVLARRGESLLDVMLGRTAANGQSDAEETGAAVADGADADDGADAATDPAARLNDPYWSQPAIFALGCALTDLWASLGVRPAAVLGNSLGEVAAAYAAGIYTLEDGLTHALARGELASRRTAEGAMAAVFAPAERVDAEVAAFNADSDGPGISVSGYNGGAQVISGRPEDIAAITKRLAADKVWVQPVAVTRAFHSALMEPMLDDMEAAVAGLALGEPSCTVVSSLEGRALSADETMDGAYWRRQMRQPVAFRDGVEALAEAGVDIVIEVGPRPLLKSLVLMSWPDSAGASPTYAPSLAGPAKGAKANAAKTSAAGTSAGGFAEAVAALYEAGVTPAFDGLFAGETRRRLAIPHYPFQKNRYWVGTEKRQMPDVHPLLGVRHELPRGEVAFAGVLSSTDPEWLEDHQVFGRVLIPAALYKSLALSAAWAPGGAGGAMVEDFQLYSPLVVPDFDPNELEEAAAQPSRDIQVFVEGGDDGAPRRLEIFSRGDGEDDWTLHADARVSSLTGPAGEPPACVDFESLTEPLQREDVAEFYRTRAQSSIMLGPRFRPLQALWVAEEGRDGQAVGELLLPDGTEQAGIEAHPILIDGCMQVTAAARMRSSSSTEGVAYLPFGCERLWLASVLPERVVCYARVRPRATNPDADTPDAGADGGADGVEPAGEASSHVEGDDQPEVAVADAWFYDLDGNEIGALIGYTFKRATRAAFLSAADDVRDLLYEIAWRDRPVAPEMPAADFLVDPSDITGTIPHFSVYVEAQGVDDGERLAMRDDLAQMAWGEILRALEQLGWERVAGEVIDPEVLRPRLGVIDERRNQFRQLFKLLSTAGVVEPRGDGFVTLVGADDPLPEHLAADREERYAAMRERYDFGWVEIGLLERCGGALPDSLRGLADPLNLLFGSGEPSATDYYLKAPVTLAANEVLADVAEKLIAERPQDRRLRVLEIGAGTGSSAEAIIGRLPEEMFDYTYTDISAGFFPDATDRLGGADAGITYQVLDIEVSPLEQGFKAHAYDLVVGGNVLHATRHLDRTLAHCAELLAPSGQLLLLETFSGGAWLDLTFGQLDGWWLLEDKYRDYVLASADIWRVVLAEVGFGEVGVLEYGDSDSTRGVIMARGPAEVTEPPGLWVLAADTSGTAEALAAELVGRNQTVLVVRDEPDAALDAALDAASGDAASGEASDESVEPAESDESGEPAEPEPAAVESWEVPAAPGITERTVAMRSRDSWKALLAGMSSDLTLQGVVHLPALDGDIGGAPTAEVAVHVERITASALAMLQGVMDADMVPAQGVTWVTTGAQVLERERDGQLAGATLWGIGKVATLEVPDLYPRRLDLDPAYPDGWLGDLADYLLYADSEQSVALRGGDRKAARVVRLGTRPERLALPEGVDWHLEPGDSGLQALRTSRRSLAPRDVRVAIDAAGINFLDVVRTMGVITQGELGREFCGRIVEVGAGVTDFAVGQRVVGMGWNCFALETVLPEELVAPAPEGIPAAALGTIPTAFVTAAWSFDTAGLGAGERVLIHVASGGVGLAAIQLARAAGAEVFATASAPKQAYLRSLGIEHVFDSRSTDFGAEILAATGGAGIDVVLNSLTSEGFIEASLSCLAAGGRFIELAKNNIWTPEQMAAARPDVAYSIVDLDETKRREPAQVGAVLRRVMERYAAGELTPLRHSRWSLNEAPAAIRHMQEARHIGKLVLTAPPLREGKLRSDRSYLVTGGLGGLGIALADWLADHGAGTIILNGRRDPDPEAVEAIAALRERGAKVVVELADVTDTAAVDAMLARIAEAQQPLAGVIHSVGVLADAALSTQTWEKFRTVLWPKVLGAWHLHRATEHLDLDLFVLFSSAAGVTGNAGQANHAAANAFLDQLAAHRRARGLPGVVIAWGAWSGLGEAEEQRERIGKLLEASGTNWITPAQGLRAMEILLNQDVMASMASSMDWPTFVAGFESAALLLEEVALTVQAGGEVSYPGGNPLAGIAAATIPEREEMLVAFLQAELQMVMQLSGEVPTTVEFSDLGMDSLMAVALRNRLNRALDGLYVAPNAVVFDHPTITRLATHVAEQLGDVVEGEVAGEVAGDAVGDAPVDGAAAPAAPSAPTSDGAAPSAPSVASLASLAGAERRARATATTATDAIAIVGMACRFPGAPDVAAFWRQLECGAHAVTDSRRDGGPWTGVAGDPAAANGESWGAFVDGVDLFDAGFFKISPAIAGRTDPQQRMLLETSWHALEDAGIDPESLRGSRTGTYAGMNLSDYAQLLLLFTGEIHYFGTDHAASLGRVAFSMGLEGPTVPLNVACSSALVAVHSAVVDLQRGDIDLALAGAVNVVLRPFGDNLGFSTRNSMTRSFDADASGYTRGEGCGIVVLKRLEDAEADGDRIWGVIRGSAVNQSGAEGGLGLPSRRTQEQVMTDALARAGVAPADLDYLEAHGSATLMGDSIELEAAGGVYGRGREPSRPLLVGSVKTNVGHLETASAAAGLVKAVLAMNRGQIPAHLHFETPNPEIAAQKLPLQVTAEAVAWPDTPGRLPLAAVNSFGLSGTNAHVVLEGHPSANGATAGAAGAAASGGAAGASGASVDGAAASAGAAGAAGAAASDGAAGAGASNGAAGASGGSADGAAASAGAAGASGGSADGAAAAAGAAGASGASADGAAASAGAAGASGGSADGAAASAGAAGASAASNGRGANGHVWPVGAPKPVRVNLPAGYGEPRAVVPVLPVPSDGAPAPERVRRLLPLSGKSAAALSDLASSYLTWLDQHLGPAAAASSAPPDASSAPPDAVKSAAAAALSDVTSAADGLGAAAAAAAALSDGATAASGAVGASGASGASAASAADLDAPLADMAWTAGVGRSHFRHRAGVVFDDAASLRAALAEIASGERPSADRGSASAPPVAFAYRAAAPGSDSAVVASLYGNEPVVRAVLDHCNQLWPSLAGVDPSDEAAAATGAPAPTVDSASGEGTTVTVDGAAADSASGEGTTVTVDGAAADSAEVGGETGEDPGAAGYAGADAAAAVSLLDVLLGRADEAAAPAWVEAAATCAWQCALAALWASVGVRPDVILGEGPGEIAAAHAAGVISLADGLRLAATLASSGDGGGNMAAAADGVPFSPPSCTLILGGEVIRRRQEFDAAAWLNRLSANGAAAGSADPAEHDGGRDEHYRGNGRATLAGMGVEKVVEIASDGLRGPVAVSAGSESETAPTTAATAPTTSATAGADRGAGSDGFVEAVAQAYEAGLDVSVEGLFVGEERRRLSLPVYPFQRRSFWLPTAKPTPAGFTPEAVLQEISRRTG